MAADDGSQQAGPHTPVSSTPEIESEVEWELTEPSSPGQEEGADTTGNEVEDVGGHESALAMDVALMTFVVPEGDFADIGEASFGPAAETVHGADDRTQISNTAVFPWRAIASLLITAADNSTWIGTAWFVGPHTLMTAGHCVFIKNSGEMISNRLIKHWDQHRRQEIETPDWLPSGAVTAGVTAGASCPNNLIEEVIERLFELKGVALPELLGT